MNQTDQLRAPTRPPTHWGQRFLQNGASAWETSEAWVLALCLLPLGIALAGAGSALLGKDVYKWVTGEDHLAEILQVAFYALALGTGIAVTQKLAVTKRHGVALLYLLVCTGLVFLLGEELSWGQRLLGWSTPESLLAVNKQGETNIHNIDGVGTAFKWLQMLVGAYGTLLPVTLLRWPALRTRFPVTRWLVPHPTLVPYFVMLFLWRFYRNAFEPPQSFYFVVSEYNEVLELVLAMGFFLFMRFQLHGLQQERREAAAPAPDWLPAGGGVAHP